MRSAYKLRKDTTHIVVHCSATQAHLDWGVDEIDELHKDRGWDGIGYHGVIRLNGRYEPGRPWNTIGAHVHGYNKSALGICLIGGLDPQGKPAKTFSPAQFNTLFFTLQLARKAYPKAVILGHRDLSPDIDGDGIIEEWEWLKECPCFDVQAWWAQVNRQVA